MKKLLLSFFMLTLLGLSANAQCVNADFSTGNFINWTGLSGNNNGGLYTSFDSIYGMVIGIPNSSPSNSCEQTIMNIPGTDPNTANVLNVLPPIGTSSCRLGNEKAVSCDSLGLGAARLSYTIFVDSTNFIFTYQYAVILQNGIGHTPPESPKFIARAFDSTGVDIDSLIIYATSNLPTFITCSPASTACDSNTNVVWQNWTIAYFNLSSYIGHNITIDFTTFDCSLGGHFGYAYISCYCGNTITVGTNEMELSNQIKIFPNPANDNLTIKIEDFRFKNLELKINDIVGNTVLENTLYNKVTNIDISSLAKGMYFVKVRTEKGVAVKKFIKE